MSVDLKQGPIHPQGSAYQTMLKHLQGNILSGHRRRHALHVFLKFKPSVTSAPARRCWLRAFVGADKWPITSAKAQLTDSGAGLFCNVFLSASGYKALGFSEAEIRDKFLDKEERGRLGRFQFAQGMARHDKLLGGSPSTQWEDVYRDRKIEVMVLLAHDCKDELAAQEQDIRQHAAATADILAVEWGHRLRRDTTFVEPFGYADGISQPRFFLPLPLSPDQDAASLDLVLLQDPFAPPAVKDCFGSYVVLQKLEQDVYGFHQRLQALRHDPEFDYTQEMAEAMVMGRFKDGTPVAVRSKKGMPQHDLNAFDYSLDPGGNKCPFHAHIRRLNPRGESAFQPRTTRDDDAERQHRIVRRGISYGTETVPNPDVPGHDVGTLFMCFQRSISNQFGFLQRVWANSTTKPGIQIRIGIDPVSGQRGEAQNDTGQPRWPVSWGSQLFKPFDFQSFVTLKGGEFFFAPSLPFFQHLECQEQTGKPTTSAAWE